MMPSSIQRAQDATIRQQQDTGALPKLLLTGAEAEAVCGLCSKTIAKFVPPVKIGRAARWRYSDLAKWVNEKAAGANGGEGGVL